MAGTKACENCGNCSSYRFIAPIFNYTLQLKETKKEVKGNQENLRQEYNDYTNEAV